MTAELTRPPRSEMNKITNRLFSEHGVDVGFQRFNKLLEEAGIGPISIGMYYRHRNRFDDMSPVQIIPVQIEPAQLNYHTANGDGSTVESTKPPERVDAGDGLQRFVKFACAVEICGGIEQAKKYLSVLDNLKQGALS